MTGSNAGVGKALATILYGADATVYVAARNAEKAEKAINEMKTAHPNSKGSLTFLHLDLNDLTTIKKSAEEFLSKEKKLDVLWNNAGVMVPPPGSKTAQGYELQLGTNCVAPFLFTKLLTPILIETAKTAAPGSVRVVWTSSSAAEVTSPKNGVDMNNLDYKKDVAGWTKYGTSKAGNWYHATEYAKLHKNDGVVSVVCRIIFLRKVPTDKKLALNPGNLATDLQRHMGSIAASILKLGLYPPIQGAYTELFAGLSPDVTIEKSGTWIQPWGRFVDIRPDLEAGKKSISEGGTGVGEKFWAWSEEQVKSYL